MVAATVRQRGVVRLAVDAGARRRWLCSVAAGAPVLWLAGCGMFGSKSAASLSGTISAAADLNPSVTQRPSPLALRLYELRATTAFDKADFIALYQSDQATLGPELVARDELVVQPGDSRSYQRQLQPDTRFIGVLAAFRDLERAVWRAVAPIQPGRAQRITIRADRLAVALTVQR